MRNVIYFIIILAFTAFLAGCDGKSVPTQEVFYPAVTNYVSDEFNVLKAETKLALVDTLTKFDSKDKGQVAVAIVKTIQPLTVEEYSIKLAEKWKVGYKGFDNGVILVLATEDRRVRIEVGRGVEDKITDGQAGRILDEKVVPFLKESKWDEGVTAGVNEIISRLSK